jgi:hypothetical protein
LVPYRWRMCPRCRGAPRVRGFGPRATVWDRHSSRAPRARGRPHRQDDHECRSPVLPV